MTRTSASSKAASRAMSSQPPEAMSTCSSRRPAAEATCLRRLATQHRRRHGATATAASKVAASQCRGFSLRGKSAGASSCATAPQLSPATLLRALAARRPRLQMDNYKNTLCAKTIRRAVVHTSLAPANAAAPPICAAQQVTATAPVAAAAPQQTGCRLHGSRLADSYALYDAARYTIIDLAGPRHRANGG